MSLVAIGGDFVLLCQLAIRFLERVPQDQQWNMRLGLISTSTPIIQSHLFVVRRQDFLLFSLIQKPRRLSSTCLSFRACLSVLVASFWQISSEGCYDRISLIHVWRAHHLAASIPPSPASLASWQEPDQAVVRDGHEEPSIKQDDHPQNRYVKIA